MTVEEAAKPPLPPNLAQQGQAGVVNKDGQQDVDAAGDDQRADENADGNRGTQATAAAPRPTFAEFLNENPEQANLILRQLAEITSKFAEPRWSYLAPSLTHPSFQAEKIPQFFSKPWTALDDAILVAPSATSCPTPLTSC